MRGGDMPLAKTLFAFFHGQEIIMSITKNSDIQTLAHYPVSLHSAAAAIWGHGGVTLSSRSARCLVDAMDRQAAERRK
jgi:hypothetical protein